ncbi:cytochrome P450 [Gloeopeniophorella convolvens]|nr:cytochrome P450 [Gloeopeniophorella convolvens]
MTGVTLSLGALVVLPATILLLLLVRHVRGPHLAAPLPPGPKGLPFIGNVLQMPQTNEWETFREWGQKWGDVLHFRLFGTEYILVNSLDAAVNMLDRKSTIYSDRPRMVMLGELMGWGRALVLSHYGDRLRAMRRFLHRFMGTRAHVAQHCYPTIERETRRFAARLLDAPERVFENIRQTTVATILDLMYGYRIKENDDPLVDLAEVVNAQFSRAATPGAFLVDVLPLLRLVPDWVPGTGWKRQAREWAVNVQKMVNIPYSYAKTRRTEGKETPSYVDVSTKDGIPPEGEDLVKWTAANTYLAGTDTTVSSESAFFLAMALFPDIRKRAQAEIDAVVGPDRLPALEDRERLPYLNAIVKELLRWNPPIPLGGPHLLVQDDIHAGYFLPKGSIVLVNLWTLLRDKNIYAAPSSFNPDRFIGSEKVPAEKDPLEIVFGFGRRVCPGGLQHACVRLSLFPERREGMHLADASVFQMCAMTLAAFDVSNPVDKAGAAITFDKVEFTSGTLFSHPAPFRCTIRPRSERAVDLVKQEAQIED